LHSRIGLWCKTFLFQRPYLTAVLCRTVNAVARINIEMRPLCQGTYSVPTALRPHLLNFQLCQNIRCPLTRPHHQVTFDPGDLPVGHMCRVRRHALDQRPLIRVDSAYVNRLSRWGIDAHDPECPLTVQCPGLCASIQRDLAYNRTQTPCDLPAPHFQIHACDFFRMGDCVIGMCKGFNNQRPRLTRFNPVGARRTNGEASTGNSPILYRLGGVSRRWLISTVASSKAVDSANWGHGWRASGFALNSYILCAAALSAAIIFAAVPP
jgi:hypothetical protein